MSRAAGRNALLTSAMIVAGIRMWNQLRGKTKTPFSEWAIGWGATFFILSVMSEVAPTAFLVGDQHSAHGTSVGRCGGTRRQSRRHGIRQHEARSAGVQLLATDRTSRTARIAEATEQPAEFFESDDDEESELLPDLNDVLRSYLRKLIREEVRS